MDLPGERRSLDLPESLNLPGGTGLYLLASGKCDRYTYRHPFLGRVHFDRWVQLLQQVKYILVLVGKLELKTACSVNLHNQSLLVSSDMCISLSA